MKRAAVLFGVLALVACTADSPPGPNDVSKVPFAPDNIVSGNASCYSFGNHEREEEVWGCVFGDPGGSTAHLTPVPSGMSSTLPVVADLSGYYRADGLGNDGAHWGWYGLGTECQPTPERHGGAGSGTEVHCVDKGTLTWQLANQSPLAIDYIAFGYPAPGNIISEGGEGAGHDVVVHFDNESPVVTPTAVMSISITKSRTDEWGSIATSGTLYAPRNMWVRVGAWNSDPVWSRSYNGHLINNGRLLMRVYWSYPNGPTGYVNADPNRPFARTHQFSNGETGTVAIEVRNPTGGTQVATVNVVGTGPLVASPTVSSTQPYVNTTVDFGAVTSPVIQDYRWSIDGSVARDWGVPAYSTSFATAGVRSVKLDVRNSSGVRDSAFLTVTVQNQPQQPPHLDSLRVYGAIINGGTATTVKPSANNSLCAFQPRLYPQSAGAVVKLFWSATDSLVGDESTEFDAPMVALGQRSFWMVASNSVNTVTSPVLTITGSKNGPLCLL